MSRANKGFLSEYERGVFEAAIQDREDREPVVKEAVAPRPPLEHATKHQPSLVKHHTVVASKQERKPHTVVNGRPKKGGGGGKGTWGNPLDPCDDLEDADPEDPIYDEEDMDYRMVSTPAPVAEAVQEHKDKILGIVREYFSSGDVSITSEELKETSGNHRYYFVKKLLSTAMDLKDKEKEMAANLLSLLYSDAVPADQMWKGFRKLLEALEDLQIDCPDAVNVVALFLARAVNDDILPPAFLQREGQEASSAASSALKLATGHLAAPEKADWLEQVWGGGLGATVRGSKAKIAKVLAELAVSGEVAEACRSIREMDLPFFHHEVVKQAIIAAIQEASSTSRQHLLALLQEASAQALITSSQMVKGVNSVLDRLDDLVLDIPTVRESFRKLLEDASHEGWLDPALSRKVQEGNGSMEEGFMEASETIARYKKRSVEIALEYFASADVAEARRSLAELAFPDLAHLFVKRLIVAAMDRKLKEKEMASVLLSELYPDTLPPDQVEAGFRNLLESVEDLALDTPTAGQELSVFLSRATVDDVLPPLFLASLAPQPQGSGQQGLGLGLRAEVVRNAQTLLAARHAGERILRAWGGTAGRSVEEAKGSVRKLLEEFSAGGGLGEACQCIRELGLPFFHHEVVKRAFVMGMERKDEKVLELLRECSAENLISGSQMRKGVQRVREEIADLALDIPNASEQFEAMLERGRSEGWLREV